MPGTHRFDADVLIVGAGPAGLALAAALADAGLHALVLERQPRDALATPGRTSASRCVPCTVPSEIHGSIPCTPSSSANTARPSSTIGCHCPKPTLEPMLSMSVSRCVPSALPSLTQTSLPCKPSLAANSARSPRLTKPCGYDDWFCGGAARSQ